MKLKYHNVSWNKNASKQFNEKMDYQLENRNTREKKRSQRLVLKTYEMDAAYSPWEVFTKLNFNFCTGVSCAEFDCQYKCLQTPHGPQCLCKNGFTLDPRTNKTCIDVDECSLNMCSQLCKNKVGSFECSCYAPHYILRSDHVSCKAKGVLRLVLYCLSIHHNF